MRHVLGLLFGLFLAPVTWFLVSLGHFRFLDALQRFGDDQDKLPTELAFGAVLIVAAGAWLGVLLSSRLSPLAPAICGLAWLGLGAAFVANVERVSNFLPNGPTGQQGIFVLPLEHGYAFLIGTALLSPLFSPARWRRPVAKPVIVDTAPAAPADELDDEFAPAPAPASAPAPARTATGAYPVVTADPDADQPSRYARPTRSGYPTAEPEPAGGRGADTGYRGATPLSDAPSYRGGADRGAGYRGAPQAQPENAPGYRGGYREQPTSPRQQAPPADAPRRQEPAPWAGERIYEETREQARHRSPDR